jgi:1-deoxy-D-xylulose-5-phosphate synthase
LHDIGVRVVNMRFVKPLDEQIIRDFRKNQFFVTVEEHAVMAGAGSAVNEFLAQAQILKPILNLGLLMFSTSSHTSQMLQNVARCRRYFESNRKSWLKR